MKSSSIFSALILGIALLTSSIASAQCGSVHSNYRNLFSGSNLNSDYLVQVTIVSPHVGNSHNYTAYGEGQFCAVNNCKSSTQTTVQFSDRMLGAQNFPIQKKDRQTFTFDFRANTIQVRLDTWGGHTSTLRNIVKRGNMYIAYGRNGSMYIFKFKRSYCLI